MDNDAFNPTGITGIAVMVGQLRAELDRLRDDTNRDLATIQTNLAEGMAERDSREIATLKLLSELTDLVEKSTVTKSTGPSGRKPTTTEDDLAGLPTLTSGERPAAYHGRVSAWALDTGQEQPPKPPVGPTANGRTYAEKVARFYEAD